MGEMLSTGNSPRLETSRELPLGVLATLLTVLQLDPLRSVRYVYRHPVFFPFSDMRLDATPAW